ncbi:uncharacterized protein MELLADRAFT_70556, partial [Melampsora larici-populina 98AG31]
MADQLQSVAQPTLSSSNELTSPDSHPSNPPVPDVAASTPTEMVRSVETNVVADRDGSKTNQASMQPTSCAEMTSPSSRPCGPPLSPKAGTAGADSADCEPVLSPISPVESEQQPRLLNSQPISLSSVPQSIPKTAPPLSPAD